jgi:hypothetical protein
MERERERGERWWWMVDGGGGVGFWGKQGRWSGVGAACGRQAGRWVTTDKSSRCEMWISSTSTGLGFLLTGKGVNTSLTNPLLHLPDKISSAAVVHGFLVCVPDLFIYFHVTRHNAFSRIVAITFHIKNG